MVVFTSRRRDGTTFRRFVGFTEPRDVLTHVEMRHDVDAGIEFLLTLKADAMTENLAYDTDEDDELKRTPGDA
jgi:hypothetical protein